MNNSISQKAKSSFIWSALEKFSVQGIAFIINLIISRIITPQDYGLIAMLSIFIAVSQTIIESGMSNFLIQRQQRQQEDFCTVFFLNITIGILCYILLYFSAPYVSLFYDQPQLKNILRVYALILIISSTTIVQRTNAYLTNKYRQLSIVSLISIIISGTTALFLAINELGVWALVSYYISQASINSILLWSISDWHPQFVFSFRSLRLALKFGWKLLVANIINTVAANLYTFAIGKKYNATDLGYYGRGQSIGYVYPSNISNLLNQAVFPILCELQDDKLRLKAVFIKYIKVATLITFIPMTLLASIAEPIVDTILGDKWLPTVPFIQILAIAYMLDPIMRLNAIATNVKGDTHYTLQSEIVKKTCLVSLLIFFLNFGIEWIAVSVIIYSAIDLITGSYFVSKVLDINIFDEFRAILPLAILSCTMATAIAITRQLIDSNMSQIFISAILFCGTSILGLKIVGLKFSQILQCK